MYGQELCAIGVGVHDDRSGINESHLATVNLCSFGLVI